MKRPSDGAARTKNEQLLARCAAAVDAMREPGLDVMVVAGRGSVGLYGFIEYLGGYSPLARAAYVVLSADHEPVVVQPTAADQALATARTGLDVRVAGEGDIIGQGDGVAAAVADVIRELGHEAGRIGIVGLHHIVSVGAYRTIVDALPEAELTDATGVLAALKASKSPEELEAVRASVGVADAGMRALAERLAPGVTGWELNGEVERAIRCRGARYSLIFVSAAPFFIQAPESRPFDEGDLVTAYVEMTSADGYWVEQARLFALGDLDDEAEQLAEACLAAAADAEALLEPGRPVAEIAAAIERRADEVGAISGIWHGHGVGIDHDVPVIAASSSATIPDGAVISIHPNFNSVSGRFGASVADTYGVHGGGADRFSDIPRDLAKPVIR